MSQLTTPEFKTISVEADGAIGWLRLNRPDRANALNEDMWKEIPQGMEWLDQQRQVRVVVLAGNGKHFTAGIDLSVLQSQGEQLAGHPCATRAREGFLRFIEQCQRSFNSMEQVRFPVIAAVHGACIGAGVDIISGCDLRLCTADARFCIKEVDVGIVPDVGTVQRLKHVIGYSATAELTYTAETFDGARARELGLVSRVCESQDDLYKAAQALAASIAAKPPSAIRAVKRNLLFSRDRSVDDGLAYAALWNAGMAMGSDVQEAMMSAVQKREAKFQD